MYPVPPKLPPPPSRLSLWLGWIVAAGLGALGLYFIGVIRSGDTFGLVLWGGTVLAAELAAWVTLRRCRNRSRARAWEPWLFWGVLALATLWLIGIISLIVYLVMSYE